MKLSIFTIIPLLLCLQGCTLILDQIEEELFPLDTPKYNDYEVGGFKDKEVSSFKQMIDDGWNVSILNGKLIFTRKGKNGIEVYRPIY